MVLTHTAHPASQCTPRLSMYPVPMQKRGGYAQTLETGKVGVLLTLCGPPGKGINDAYRFLAEVRSPPWRFLGCCILPYCLPPLLPAAWHLTGAIRGGPFLSMLLCWATHYATWLLPPLLASPPPLLFLFTLPPVPTICPHSPFPPSLLSPSLTLPPVPTPAFALPTPGV